MKGLEITEIQLNHLKIDNWTLRIDSEYFKKEYLLNLETLKRNGFIKLKQEIINLTGGATPLGANYANYGIPFLRVQNVMQNYFNLNDVVYLSQKQDNEIKRSRLKLKDVLLTITGVSYGKSATVNSALVNANINQHSVKITLKETLNPYFLSTFLNSRFGKLQSDKNVVGVTRPALDYKVIRNFIIPKMEYALQLEIENVILKSEAKLENSKELYKQAEELLLDELGLTNFEPSKESVNIKSFSESFGTSGRLDSEFYLPKYEEIESKVCFEKKGVTQIKNQFKHIKNNSKKELINYFYLEIGDVSVSDGTYELNKFLNKDELPANAKIVVKKGDLLVSKVRPNRGAVTIIKDEKENLIVSGAFTVLRKNTNSFLTPEILKLLLRTNIFKEWLLKFNVGSSYPVVKDADILNLPVPRFPESFVEILTKEVKNAEKLKKQSENLLEVAKRAVEIAIEEDEETALKFIEENQNV